MNPETQKKPLSLDPDGGTPPELPLVDSLYIDEVFREAVHKISVREHEIASRLKDVGNRAAEMGVRFSEVNEPELFDLARRAAWQKIQAHGRWDCGASFAALLAYGRLITLGRLAITGMRIHARFRRVYLNV